MNSKVREYLVKADIASAWLPHQRIEMREQASEKLRNSGAIWLGSRKAWTTTGFRPYRTAEGLDRLGYADHTPDDALTDLSRLLI
jgi:hypothetical protein